MRVEAEGSWNPPGRTPSWRLSMLIAGLVLAGIGVAILLWPWLIVWAIAGVFLLLGAFCLLSALLARGGGSPAPDGVFVEVIEKTDA